MLIYHQSIFSDLIFFEGYILIDFYGYDNFVMGLYYKIIQRIKAYVGLLF